MEARNYDLENPHNARIRPAVDDEDLDEKLAILKRAIMLKFGETEASYTAAFPAILAAINRTGSNDKKSFSRRFLRAGCNADSSEADDDLRAGHREYSEGWN